MITETFDCVSAETFQDTLKVLQPILNSRNIQAIEQDKEVQTLHRWHSKITELQCINSKIRAGLFNEKVENEEDCRIRKRDQKLIQKIKLVNNFFVKRQIEKQQQILKKIKKSLQKTIQNQLHSSNPLSTDNKIETQLYRKEGNGCTLSETTINQHNNEKKTYINYS